MNMNNMYLKFFVIILLCFTLFSYKNVFAETTTTTQIACSSLDETQCGYYSKCMWNNNSCIDQYVAHEPCTDKRILLVLRFFGYLLAIAKVAIPLIIIGFGTLDLFKSVMDKDEKSLTKQTRILLVRIAIGIFIFFIPALVKVVFNISAKTSIKEEYSVCSDCLLTPSKCSVDTLKSTPESTSTS